MCLYVCVCERERERDAAIDRQTDRQTDRHTYRQTEKQRERGVHPLLLDGVMPQLERLERRVQRIRRRGRHLIKTPFSLPLVRPQIRRNSTICGSNQEAGKRRFGPDSELHDAKSGYAVAAAT